MSDKEGRTLPVGQQGQLLTRGYLVMKGYWNDPEFTAEAIRDGWMHTGDLATIDAEGYCQITGRAGDMLIRGGENVYPAEVEDLLTTHPDIAQAQVFGFPMRGWAKRSRPGSSCAPKLTLTARRLRRTGAA